MEWKGKKVSAVSNFSLEINDWIYIIIYWNKKFYFTGWNEEENMSSRLTAFEHRRQFNSSKKCLKTVFDVKL